MNITKVTIKKVEETDTRLKGYATVEIEGMFVIGDIRVIQGDDKLFIAFPSRKTNTGAYRDICHPINADCRKLFEDAVLNEFNKEETE